LEKHKIFNEILLEGILEENGMANFSSILTEQEVNHVHNYIIDRATKDRITEKNK
jgi:quinohemoprotein ethanol dehydrogenase